MRRRTRYLTGALCLVAAVLFAQTLSTKQNDQLASALTDDGQYGWPPYSTLNLPACNSASLGACAYDTTAQEPVCCDGTAWGSVGGGAFVSWIGYELDEYSGKRYEFSNPPRTAADLTAASTQRYEVLSTVTGLTGGDTDFFQCVRYQASAEGITGRLFEGGGDVGASDILSFIEISGGTNTGQYQVYDDTGTFCGSVTVQQVHQGAPGSAFFCAGFVASVDEVRGFGIQPDGDPVTVAPGSCTATPAAAPIRVNVGSRKINVTPSYDRFYDGGVQTAISGAGELTAALTQAFADAPSTCAGQEAAAADEGVTMDECWELPGGDTPQLAFKVTDGGNDLTAVNAPGQATGFSTLSLTESGGIVPRAPHPNTELQADFDDASAQFISVADNATVSAGDIPFYYGGWFVIDDSAAAQTLIAKATAETAAGLEYRVSVNSPTTNVGCAVSDGTVLTTATSVGAVTVGTPFHVLCIHDSAGNTIGVRLDGATVVTAANPTLGIQDGTGSFKIGRFVTAPFDLDGAASNVFIGKDLPTTAEGDAMVNGGVPVPIRRLSFVNPDLVLTEGWPLTEGSGTRAAFLDATNDLAATGAPIARSGDAPRAYVAPVFVSATPTRLHTDLGFEMGPESTVLTYIKPDDLSAGQYIVTFGNNAANGNAGIHFRNASGDILGTYTVQPDCTSTGAGANPTTPALEGQWNTVGFRHSHAITESAIWMNGEKTVGSGYGGGCGVPTTLIFGSGRTTNSAPFDGQVGPTAVYADTALADEQILLWSQSYHSCAETEQMFGEPSVCCELRVPAGDRVCTGSAGTFTLTDVGPTTSDTGIIDLESHTLPALALVSASSQYVEGPTMNFGTGDFSLATHFISDSTAPAIQVLWGMGATGNGSSDLCEGLMWFVNSTLNRVDATFGEEGCTTRQPNPIGSAFQQDMWHSTVLSADRSANVLLFLDGAQVGSASMATATGNILSGAPMRLGALSSGTSPTASSWLNGNMSVTATFAAALDADQALAWNNSGAGLRCEDVEAVVGVAPTECWPLTEREDVRAATVTTPGNDLTAVNNPESVIGVTVGELGYGSHSFLSVAELITPDQGAVRIDGGGSTEFVAQVMLQATFGGPGGSYSIFRKGAAGPGGNDEYQAVLDNSTRLAWNVRESGASVVQCILSPAFQDRLTPEPVTVFVGYDADAGELFCASDYIGVENEVTIAFGTPRSDVFGDLQVGDDATADGATTALVIVPRKLTVAERECVVNGGYGRALADLVSACGIK